MAENKVKPEGLKSEKTILMTETEFLYTEICTRHFNPSMVQNEEYTQIFLEAALKFSKTATNFFKENV